jgi:hypothetical protein
MKIFTLLLTLLLPLGLIADCNEIYDPGLDGSIPCCPPCFDTCYDCPWTLEVRLAYYQPIYRLTKKLYSHAWLDYQVEVSRRVQKYLEIWGGVYWATKHGNIRSSGYGHRVYDDYSDSFKNGTKIYVLPLCLGMKFVYPLRPCLDFYLGVGICYSFLEIRNHCKEHYSYWGYHYAPFRHVIHKNGLGATFKAGLRYDLCATTFLDFFVDYFAQRFKFSHHDDESGRIPFNHYLDCSGFKYGAGIGVYF